jgi:hypothetical protein
MAQLAGRRLAFVQHVAQGKSVTDAARSAGYSDRHARGRGYTLMRDPKIADAVAEIQRAVKEKAAYGLEQAVAEADGLMAQARELKQMTAAAKLFDTKMKLYSLLVDRVAVEMPSLIAAIEAGRARAAVLPHFGVFQAPIDVTPRKSNSLPPTTSEPKEVLSD